MVPLSEIRVRLNNNLLASGIKPSKFARDIGVDPIALCQFLRVYQGKKESKISRAVVAEMRRRGWIPDDVGFIRKPIEGQTTLESFLEAVDVPHAGEEVKPPEAIPDAPEGPQNDMRPAKQKPFRPWKYNHSTQQYEYQQEEAAKPTLSEDNRRLLTFSLYKLAESGMITRVKADELLNTIFSLSA